LKALEEFFFSSLLELVSPDLREKNLSLAEDFYSKGGLHELSGCPIVYPTQEFLDF